MPCRISLWSGIYIRLMLELIDLRLAVVNLLPYYKNVSVFPLYAVMRFDIRGNLSDGRNLICGKIERSHMRTERPAYLFLCRGQTGNERTKSSADIVSAG